jgi:26S proteasome regulatory subunit N1
LQAGALLAAGIMSSQVHDENDPALAVLSEFINSEKASHRITSIMGLGIAYSGSNRDDLKDLFLPIITDTSLDTVIPATAAFALGQIFLGQGAKPDNEIAPAMAQALLEMPPEQLSSPWMRFYILGLAMLFFGKQDASDAFVETLKTIEHPIAQEAIVMLTMCSFAGTGEVLRIQQMLRLCAEKKEEGKEEGKEEKKEEEGESAENREEEKKDEGKGEFSQSLAVLAIAAIAMGEDVGKELSMRHFGHLVPHPSPFRD